MNISKNKMEGLYVIVRNGNVESALRIFKRKIKDANLMKEIESHRFYIKPSAKKRDMQHRQIARSKYSVENDL